MEELQRQRKEEMLIWESEPPQPESMVSVTIGRAMTALLTARSKKLLDSIPRLSPDSAKRPSLGSLEDSLWFLHKFSRDAANAKLPGGESLDQVLIPLIQHLLSRDHSRKRDGLGQALILINWMFQDEVLFEAVASNLADVIARKEDKFIALGWCVLVRALVEYESFSDRYTLNGVKDNYSALLKILCSCVPHLLSIMCKGSVLQDGFELPSRLAVSAADCILVISEALTKKSTVATEKPKSLISSASDRPIALVPAGSGEKKLKPTYKPLEVTNIEMACLLWEQTEELITLLQRLLAWSRKSRPLQAKGVEQVLKWLLEVKWHYGQAQDETGTNIQKTRALLLSSCWKHYSILLLLEDYKFSQRCNELLEHYISGIQYYTDNHPEGHMEDKDASMETRKFFLNCLCLLLGKFDSKRFGSVVSDYRIQLSRVLISQLQCADEDVITGAASIFKAAFFKANCSSGSGPGESREMDAVVPLLLNLLDERDGTARAVVLLVAEYCSMSGDCCFEQVLKRLASGNTQQRRNAIDVISELVSISLNSGNKLSHLPWQDIADSLLRCLADGEIIVCEQASSLLSMIDPSLVLPGLVHLLYSSNEGVQSHASAAFINILKDQNSKPEIICMLIDCLSNISQSIDFPKTTGGRRGVSREDMDRVLKLIPEWSKTVQDWTSLVGPLIDKMFAEPANATIVRFLSCISEYLAQVADLVLHRVLMEMMRQKDIDEGVLSIWGSKTYTSEDSATMQNSLFERLSPLLIIRLLPLRVFNDLNCSIMYGRLPDIGIDYESGDIKIIEHDCVAPFILKRAFSDTEFEDVRKLAAELCGRMHPQVLFPIVSRLLDHSTDCHDTLKIKAILFSVCTSLAVRGRDSVLHTAISDIRKALETVLLWPSLDGDEISKAQHGCIDCLALMICAELQSLSSRTSPGQGNSVLNFVIHRLLNDKNEVVPASASRSDNHIEAPVPNSFRLCMANVLISACQKISDSGKKPFAQKTIPCLIHSVELVIQPEIRAACVQVLFSAVYHLKPAVLLYSSDLLKLSLRFLRKGLDQERIAGAKLMASLMASEEDILEDISEGLLEARSVLSNLCASNPSHEVLEICKKLLSCITMP